MSVSKSFRISQHLTLLLRMLLLILCCTVLLSLAVLVEGQEGSSSIDTTSTLNSIRRCSKRRMYKPDYGCNDNSLIVSYNNSIGLLQCNGSYTLGQTQTIPTIQLISAEVESLYTILLVDTSDSSMHPIMHFGANNIQGSELRNGIDLKNIGNTNNTTNILYKYRGPAPPNFLKLIPGIRRQRFIYEWIIAKQQSTISKDPSKIRSTVNVQYKQLFLNNTDIVSTSLFLSGFCVQSKK